MPSLVYTWCEPGVPDTPQRTPLYKWQNQAILYIISFYNATVKTKLTCIGKDLISSSLNSLVTITVTNYFSFHVPNLSIVIFLEQLKDYIWIL